MEEMLAVRSDALRELRAMISTEKANWHNIRQWNMHDINGKAYVHANSQFEAYERVGMMIDQKMKECGMLV